MESISNLQDLKKEFQQISDNNLAMDKNSLSSVGYMDIETTGLSSEHNHITLIGLHSSDATSVYIDTQNHKKACQDIDKCRYLVTFNGNRFDLPFINKHYGLQCNFKSIDLMYLFWQMGYYGGLKKVEQQLGLSRMSEVEGMKGSEAVTLWHKYKAGNQEALNKLVNYNIEDIVNLEVLFNFALQRAQNNTISSDELKQNKKNIMNRIKNNESLYIWD
ncbi:MAG: hypothetical protein COT14_02755 [Candidatus Diapherotrites archaeon CG08_land_8_20_14_0_20_30_16]|nr:MAG: hypothetical protein COT14_02755 [Candidatus Diapherotrites archaeon CG08_land_8_20_14_0_20_30_16]